MSNMPCFVYSGHIPEGIDGDNPCGFSVENLVHDGYPVLLGLLPELPGSLPQHMAWVQFPSLKAVETLFQEQNSVDFASAKSPRKANEQAQARAQARRASVPKKPAKGGSIFEILNVSGGNIHVYRKAKMAEEYESRVCRTLERSSLPPKASSPAQAMASFIPYAAFRSTNLLLRLVAIAGAHEFIAIQENALVS